MKDEKTQKEELAIIDEKYKMLEVEIKQRKEEDKRRKQIIQQQEEQSKILKKREVEQAKEIMKLKKNQMKLKQQKINFYNEKK
jgi:hypothetical protein